LLPIAANAAPPAQARIAATPDPLRIRTGEICKRKPPRASPHRKDLTAIQSPQAEGTADWSGINAG